MELSLRWVLLATLLVAAGCTRSTSDTAGGELPIANSLRGMTGSPGPGP